MDIYRVAKRRGKYPTLATLATVKLRISCDIYLRAIREKMASPFASATSEEMIQIIFLVYIIYTKTTIHLGKFQPRATSTSVNSC